MIGVVEIRAWHLGVYMSINTTQSPKLKANSERNKKKLSSQKRS